VGRLASTMRVMPSRQSMPADPISACMRLLSVVTDERVCSVGSNFASIPASSAMRPHHSSMLACAPAQFTIVAGTVPASSSSGTWRTMSSEWIGLNRFGWSECTGMAIPASIIFMWNQGQPPWSP